MHSSTFVFFSAAATFLGQATGFPRIHYVWTQQTTEILDDGNNDYCNTAAGDICPWTPHRLPMVLNDNVPFDTDTDIDSTDRRLAGPGGDTDHHTPASAADVKVGVPAVVYPHDTNPTPTAKDGVATKVACPSTFSTSTLMKLQPRHAKRDVDVADIPKSIKSEESHGPYPGQTPAPLAIQECGSIWHPCPAGWDMELLAGGDICLCRQSVPTTVEVPYSM
ncbi:hypothetical protein LTS07_007282 [Exophiala sideris]|uniref:Uncharacterized protein n=1 Tax=Exophiala sideris TaxID=1016849 RepID=A0ABR0J3U4_9EURO|nr:hypothetical protein LTS07_007282 [Exophiala sideris]KAK5033987.1 hypothetical protein LTR13_006587 [Exophiala sideris]KAK5055739.1 hypothetical protein LTR69_008114 [Exophiala sideris]KAK5180929.1 hypothetical protein LTR44_006749 [Eurotiomycetes sp. CCFEE 6388]